MLKSALLFVVILYTGPCFSQNDSTKHRHSGAMQFGGQMIVALNYEYTLVSKKHFKINTLVGLGLNENADDLDPDDTSIRGIQSGVVLLAGINPIYLEIGVIPTAYFYRSMSFINLNGWFGLRFYPRKVDGFYLSVGYTPKIYTSFTDANNNFFGAMLGVKVGILF